MQDNWRQLEKMYVFWSSKVLGRLAIFKRQRLISLTKPNLAYQFHPDLATPGPCRTSVTRFFVGTRIVINLLFFSGSFWRWPDAWSTKSLTNFLPSSMTKKLFSVTKVFWLVSYLYWITFVVIIFMAKSQIVKQVIINSQNPMEPSWLSNKHQQQSLSCHG